MGYSYDVSIETLKNHFGLKEITPAMFKSMVMATSWDQVTDTIRTINSLGYVSNYNKDGNCANKTWVNNVFIEETDKCYKLRFN